MPRTLLPAVGRLLADPRPDAALVADFLRDADHAAFAELVRRHGPLVLGVCRRTLGHAADADDAFQATFLVLVRRARRVAWRGSLGPWLYGVAVRVSRKARAARARRAAVERRAAMTAEPAITPPDPDDAAAVLDEELAALPEAVRGPLVLCELQGLSRRDAARQLGLAEGTLSSRLARGRKLLRGRLARRGVVPAAGGLCVSVPAELATATAGRAVAVLAGAAGAVPAGILALTDGVMKTMAVSSWKLAAVVVAVGIGMTGFGGWRGDGPGPVVGTATAADPPAAKQKRNSAGMLVAVPVLGPLPIALDFGFPIPADRQTFALNTIDYSIPISPQPLMFSIGFLDHGTVEKDRRPTDRPVATIFGNVDISREEFAEYLIRRYGAKELEAFVNKQIVRDALGRLGHTVTGNEVTAALDADAKSAGMTREQFVKEVLPGRGKTEAEWVEDVVIPRLMLAKMGGKRVGPPTEAELRAAFDRKYGPQVECVMIHWTESPVSTPADRERIAAKLRAAVVKAQAVQVYLVGTGEDDRTWGGSQSYTVSRAGFDAENPAERVAARLKVGETSEVFQVGRGFMVLRAIDDIRADATKTFAGERAALAEEVARAKLDRELPALFAELKRMARPEYHLTFPGTAKK